MPQKLFMASLFTQLFPFEDVYIGFLVKKLSGKIVSLKKYFCFKCYKPLTNEIKNTFFWISKFVNYEHYVVAMSKIAEKMKEIV
jgi:hypothetical protein